MNKLILSIFFLTTGFSSLARANEVYTQPLLAIACHFNPYLSTERANGYDCFRQHAIYRGEFSYSEDMPLEELILQRSHVFNLIARKATAKCGMNCRYFYGSIGDQCLAIAQNRRFTGLGSFMGREMTQEEAEYTALQDCESFVGSPGASCHLVVSVCAR